MNYELGRMWKETVVAYVKVGLPQNLPERTEENQGNFSHDGKPWDQ
jgi:hypothetical protein